jgi:LPS-assembly protein
MQIKNKLLILFFIILCVHGSNLNADEFNITAKEIFIDKENEILRAEGSVESVDTTGRIIRSDKIIYEKKREFLISQGNVEILDLDGNVLKTDKAIYNKTKEIITTFGNTKVILKEGYKLTSKNIIYNIKNKILSSKNKSVFTDKDKNYIETSMFNYYIENNLFSSIGKIKIIDAKNNKYYFKELHVDTKKKEIIGSNVSVVLDQNTFGVSKESDPRFVSNDIFLSKNKSELSKGVFTICKKRDGKCPPWSLKAKKIKHDLIKKTIYYDHAILKVYDVPIFYFPKFFHPDPTVKRQSGLLAPFLTNSSTIGTGLETPYFWAISDSKDMTFTPKTYTKENILLLNEYRQAFRNGFLTLDSSYTEGYKDTSATKTGGSRNHLFANLDLNFSESELFDKSLSIKVQTTSNNTYFRVHDINTALVDSDNTNLESEIEYNFSKDDMYIGVNANVYENLGVKNSSDKYEFIIPNINYGKTFFTEKFGIVDFKSNALYSNYETNKHKAFLTNDIIWNPYSYISKGGFVNTIEGMIRNTNYETRKTSEYKDDKTVNELNGVISYKSSLPLIKRNMNISNLFSPIVMLRYSPGHMRNLRTKDLYLNSTNLYSLNKTSEIEDGISAILGFDYKINERNDLKEREKLALSLGQVFRNKTNKDIPAKSSLDQKMSDIVGEINYNFAEIGNIDYKFSLDHNINDLNYNDISTTLNFGKVEFNLDYLEQQNHIGEEHYASSGVTLNFNDNNLLNFSTKKNFKTDSTELYDLSYQYAIDCLTAGMRYRREFYQDVDDLEPKDSLMFTITFVPFTSVNSPNIKQ